MLPSDRGASRRLPGGIASAVPFSCIREEYGVKKHEKTQRMICIIMAALTIISAPMVSYMEAQAGELVLDIPFIEQLLIMFGINAGLGEQSDFWSRQKELDALFEAAADGSTAELSNYGTVDFSDAQSLQKWFQWSIDCQQSLLGNLSILDAEHAAQYMQIGKALDKASYNNSGTCATNALYESISAFYDDRNANTEALVEDIQSCFTVVNEGGSFDDAIDSNAEKAARRQKFWKTFCAVTAAGLIGSNTAALPLAALKEYGNSEFNDYEAAFGEACFDGNYEMNASGYYRVMFSCTNTADDTVSYFEKWSNDGISSKPIVGVINNSENVVYLYNLYNSSLNPVFLGFTVIKPNQGGATSVSSSRRLPYNNFSCNFPLYPSEDAALNALKADNFSDAENIQKSYADFKQNTGTAGAVIGTSLNGYVGALKSFADLIDIIPAVKEASDTYGGTAEMLPEIAKILAEGSSLIVDQPEADDPNKSNYSGILSKILAAINGLPAKILSAFSGKFMTAEHLETLLNSIPVVLAGVISDAYTDSQISVLPGILSDVLSSVFPDAASAIKALIDLPAYIVSAVSGIQVKVPDIAVPDIVIPEIVIPDIVIPDIVIPEIVIPDIAAPDVFVDSPDITIENMFDVASLGDVISGSVEKVMTDVFVPSEELTLQRVGEMQEYFKFTDDMKEIISEFEKSVFGITPSPILKIPIGKPKSKKYNYGTGNYIIIDVGWYAEYKDFGDKIILAFAWVFFIWRMFVLLPGIISGTVGGFFTPERVERMTMDADIKYAYGQYHGLKREYTNSGGNHGRFTGKFKD